MFYYAVYYAGQGSTNYHPYTIILLWRLDYHLMVIKNYGKNCSMFEKQHPTLTQAYMVNFIKLLTWKSSHFFIYLDLVATTGVPKKLPFAGGSDKPKTVCTPAAVPIDMVSAFWRHRSGYTQAPPTGPYCTSGAPPEVPSPFLYRVESVPRSILY